ncbi:MAG: LysR family transcriptional regulator [Halanaerobium sp.]|nr:LysR family transcriptional regulator [Halanaerobium sp.]
MKLNFKLWLEKDDKVFGDGPCDILERIDRLGSLSQAAREINMSYSQAWELIDSLEKKLGFKLLEKQAGGVAGGGSSLTTKGRILMERFSSFRKEAEQSLSRLEEKWFGPDFHKLLNDADQED